MSNVILASASPRRQELLKNIFEEFEIMPADIDESVDDSIAVEERPELIARKKAEHIAKDHPDSLVIGCDTAVIADGEMLGKPSDRAGKSGRHSAKRSSRTRSFLNRMFRDPF